MKRQHHLVVLAVAVAALFGSVSPIFAAETTVQSILNEVDDTSCHDGIGRTYTYPGMLASTSAQGNAVAFVNKHWSCLGGPQHDLALQMSGACSPDLTLIGRSAQWIVCLIWFDYSLGGTRFALNLSDFQLITADDQTYPAYAQADLYEGQRDDISGGVYLLGEGGRFGLIAFGLPESGEATPLLLFWKRTGDILIVDEREPEVGRRFVENDWS